MFIKPTIVRAYVHGKGKRCTRAFLQRLDARVNQILDRVCTTHRRTLDDSEFMGIPPTPSRRSP